MEETHDQDEDAIRGKNILVAEDNAVNQLVIKNMLKKLGAQCRIAEDGLLAAEAFEQANDDFDIILMDFEMPNMDGCDATIRIREFEKNLSQKAITIIGLSAHATVKHQELCIEAGMNDHLSKPIELAVPKEKLRQYL
jgi:CheY-like chemotaxis protein